MKRVTALLAVAAVLTGAAILTGNRAAFSEGTELTQIKKDLAALIDSQQTILQELKAIREELNVVKIRCSS